MGSVQNSVCIIFKGFQETNEFFLESLLLKLNSEVFYYNLFFREFLIGNEKTPGAKLFTSRVLQRPEKWPISL